MTSRDDLAASLDGWAKELKAAYPDPPEVIRQCWIGLTAAVQALRAAHSQSPSGEPENGPLAVERWLTKGRYRPVSFVFDADADRAEVYINGRLTYAAPPTTPATTDNGRPILSQAEVVLGENAETGRVPGSDDPPPTPLTLTQGEREAVDEKYNIDAVQLLTRHTYESQDWQHGFYEMRIIALSLLRAERAGGGREGWVLVPKEPTEAMVEAYCTLALRRIRDRVFGSGDGPGIVEGCKETYRAMVAAAPSPGDERPTGRGEG